MRLEQTVKGWKRRCWAGVTSGLLVLLLSGCGGGVGFGIVDVTTKEADLEDVFLSLTSGSAE